MPLESMGAEWDNCPADVIPDPSALFLVFGDCFKQFIGFCLCLRVAWRLELANASSNSLVFAFV